MIASKRKSKRSLKKTRKALKMRRLRMRRNLRFWALYRRFLLSQVDTLVTAAAKKRRTRRFFRQSDRRWSRRRLISNKLAHLYRKQHLRPLQRVIHKAGALVGSTLRRTLRLTRGKALFAVCRRLRAATCTYRTYSARSRVTALRQYRRALQRGKTARWRKAQRSRAPQRRRYFLCKLPQLSPPQALGTHFRTKSLRRNVVLLLARRRLQRWKVTVARSRPWARRRLLLIFYRRRRYRIKKKYGRRRARRRRRKSGRKAALRPRPRVRKRRTVRAVGAKLKLRFFLKQRMLPTRKRRASRRLSRRLRGGLRLWLFLKRATKRVRIRARHAKPAWQKRTRNLIQRTLRRRTVRPHRKQKLMQRRLRAKKRRGMFHKRRRYAARTRAKRRLRPRHRRLRIRFLLRTRKKTRRRIRRFLKRRAARALTWLRAVTRKARSSSLRNSLAAAKYRPSAATIFATRRPTTARKTRLFILRAALRSRIRLYRRKRKVLRRHLRRSGVRRRLRRQRGRRVLLFSKLSKGFYPKRRDARRTRRERRKYYQMIRRRGRAWGRWRRLPRRYFSPYLRVIRHNFASKPRLFNRGAWTYFYRDREFSPNYRSQLKIHTVRKLLGVRYPQLRRGASLRLRSRRRPMWHTMRGATRQLRHTLIKKNKNLARMLRRRIKARLHRVSGAVYGFKGHTSPHFGFLVRRRKNVFRRWVTRRISRYRPRRKRKTLPLRPLPLVLGLHPFRSRRLSVASGCLGAYVSRAFVPRFSRRARRNVCFVNVKNTQYHYTTELQQNLFLYSLPRPLQKRAASKKLLKPSVRHKNKSPRTRRLLKKIRLSRFWFKQLRHRFFSTRRHMRRIAQKLKRRKPNAWKSLLTLLDCEFELEPALDTALEFLDSPNVRIKTQPETETQDDETT